MTFKTEGVAMRYLLLASIVALALGATDSAHGDWRTYGTPNRISPNGLWWRGYGRLGYGWYSIYGAYVGPDYSTIGFGYRSRLSGFNFNRIDNYGFTNYGITAPWVNGYRAR